ncbi:hypothetical protein LbDm2_2190 [Levilactobacillus brevis]|nr:hypothetical protein LbDm2_2190 [Levilactobacillus brevis]
MMVPKFRAWNMPFGPKGPLQEMVYGKASSILAFAEMSPDKYIVEQSTGLKDANGKEIYEGDIVRMHVVLLSPDDKVGYVEYHKKYGYSLIMKDRRCRQEYWAADDKATYEVIGNIHENPELLEGKVE